MKKIISLLLCFVLIFSVFAFASCGIGGESGENGETEEGGNETKENDTRAAETKSDSGLEFTKSEAQAKLDALGETDGFRIKFRYLLHSEETTISIFGRKDNVLWLLSEDEEGNEGGMAYALLEDEVMVYSLEDGEWSHLYSISFENYEELKDSLTYISGMFLFWGNDNESNLTKGADTTVAGRPCYTYSYYDGYAGYSIGYNVMIDKELGITLALHMVATEVTERATMDFEVLEFQTGNDVTLPALPQAASIFDEIGIAKEACQTAEIAEITTSMQSGNRVYLALTAKDSETGTFNAFVASMAALAQAAAEDGAVYVQNEDFEYVPFTSFTYDAETSPFANLFYNRDGKGVSISLTIVSDASYVFVASLQDEPFEF